MPPAPRPGTSSSAQAVAAPGDIGAAGLGGQLAATLNPASPANVKGASEAATASPEASTPAQPTGETVNVLITVGGRGLAADADLGRSAPLSGAAPNVFCTAHSVAAGTDLDPSVRQYFAPRHNCR